MLKKGRVVEFGLRFIVLVSGEIRMLLVLVCYQVLMIGQWLLLIILQYQCQVFGLIGLLMLLSRCSDVCEVFFIGFLFLCISVWIVVGVVQKMFILCLLIMFQKCEVFGQFGMFLNISEVVLLVSGLYMMQLWLVIQLMLVVYQQMLFLCRLNIVLWVQVVYSRQLLVVCSIFFGLLVELEVQRMNNGFFVFMCFGLQVDGWLFMILWNQWLCGVCMFIVLLVWCIISMVLIVFVFGSFSVVLMLVFSGILWLLCKFLLVVMISLFWQLLMWLVIEFGVKLLNIIEWIVLMCVQVSMVIVVLMIIGRQMVIWLFFLILRLCSVLLRWQVCLYSL